MVFRGSIGKSRFSQPVTLKTMRPNFLPSLVPKYFQQVLDLCALYLRLARNGWDNSLSSTQLRT